MVIEKHVLRYLKGTLDHGLWYISDHEFGLYGYSDSDWADNIPDQNIVRNIPDQKSNSRYCFSLGSSMVSWSRVKQSCMTLSKDEAEYVATCAMRREAICL